MTERPDGDHVSITPWNIAYLQATAGNKAVARHIRSAAPVRGDPVMIQRQRGTGVAVSEKGAKGAALVSSDRLETDMRDTLRAWKTASQQGVDQFAIGVLSEKVANLESGSAKNLILSLIGNTIWASTAFFPPGAAVVFAVSMAGIGIASIPAIPNPTKSNIPQIHDAMLDYLDEVFRQLNEQLPAKAVALLKDAPQIGRFEAVARFINASFLPAFRYEYKPYDKLPQLNEERVRDSMLRKATYEYEAAERAEAGMRSATHDFAGLARPLPGTKETRKTYFGGYIKLRDKVEAVTNAYGRRANVDVEYPRHKRDETVLGSSQSLLPPTTYFYHWLSRHYLGGTEDERKILRDQLPGDLTKILSTMTNTRMSQTLLRAELANAVRKKTGKEPTDTLLYAGKMTLGSKYSYLKRPYPSAEYDAEATAVVRQISGELEELLQLVRHKGTSPEKEYAKERLKL